MAQAALAVQMSKWLRTSARRARRGVHATLLSFMWSKKIVRVVAFVDRLRTLVIGIGVLLLLPVLLLLLLLLLLLS